MFSFDQILKSSSIVSFIGTGGVGKTTFSMTAAVAAAMSGKKVAAITVDPSKRLSSALGFALDESGKQRLDWPELQGILDVYVLDAESTFKDFVNSHLPEGIRQRMATNRLFEQISKNLRETHNFSAIYKLHQIEESKDYDLIVLDTPPSQAAIDFFEAPERLKKFFAFDGFDKINSFGWASWVGEKSLSIFKKMIEKFAGGDFLNEMLVFFANVGGLRKEIDQVTSNLMTKMTSSNCSFVLVTSPNPEKFEESIGLMQDLSQRGYQTQAAIINQAYPDWLDLKSSGSFEGDKDLQLYFELFYKQKKDAEELKDRLEEEMKNREFSVATMPSFSFASFTKKEILELGRHLKTLGAEAP